MENAAQCVDAVVHLVGIIREVPSKGTTFEKLHVAATRNAVRAAERWEVARFIHMSALGAGPEGGTPYFETKWRAEEIVRRSGLQFTIFRPSIIFGEGDHFIGELVRLLPRFPVIPVIGDGQYRLQPVHAGDVARGFAEALARPETAGRTFEVGGPDRLTYDGLLDAVAAAAGRAVRKVHVPLPLVRAAVSLMERSERSPVTNDQIRMLLKESVCDSRPFHDAFGFDPLSLPDYLAGKGPAKPHEEKPAAGAPPSSSARKAA
jgi:NADH dehydrogenase